jgi:beta-lactamase regulating signal transducer with metallopeptidase domain
MRAEVLQVLIDTTLALSAAVLIVRLLRKPLQVTVGARTAYWVWILVPTTVLAVLLPAPSPMLASAQVDLPGQIRTAFSVATASESISYRAELVNLALMAWAVGTGAMCLSMLARQRSFLRSLGTLTRDANGLHRSDTVLAPMLLGSWRPKIVVPTDFESRYSPEECALVLAHERAHESRGDVAINLAASVALCVYWFNPLIYRALAWLRIDQELACDALVLAQRRGVRRRYADALLKAQVATESTLRQPIGCHWQSTHPLNERISMLKRPLPGRLRRLAGLAFIAFLTGVSGYAAWAGQAVSQDDRAILIGLKVTVSDPQKTDVHVLNYQVVVRSGESIQTANAPPLDLACTPYLADQPGHPTDWSDQKARGIPLPRSDQILLDCAIRRDGKALERPAVIVGDGKTGTIETNEPGGPHRYRIEITPSTSPEKIAAARRQSGGK